MFLPVAKTLGLIVTFVLITHTFARAVCPVDSVVVRGQINDAPSNAKVRVQLVYPKDLPGEAGDVTIENGRFALPLDFLTESRRPIINGAFEKCNRRPKTVIATLVDTAHSAEYDRVSLDFAKDFKRTDSKYIHLEGRNRA